MSILPHLAIVPAQPLSQHIDMMPEDIVAEYRLPSNIGMSFMYVVGGCFDCICLIEKYRKWLVSSDPSTNHNNAIKKHHLDTGLWLLEHSMYKDWKWKPNSFMWIHGICEQISIGFICQYSHHCSWCRKNNSFVS